MKIILALVICFISVTCFGQTKLIAHKSHSGSNADFRLAINKNLFDIDQSNFGIVVRTLKSNVDTVVLKSKNTMLLHRVLVQEGDGSSKRTRRFIETVNKSNYPDFFNVDSKENLNKLIKKTYRLDSGSTTFIGFDKKFFKKQSKN